MRLPPLARAAALLLAAGSLAGCATAMRATSGSLDDVLEIRSTPPGAEAVLSNGKRSTPCALSLSRWTTADVSFTLPGYKTAQATISNEPAGAGAAGMAGNILIGGAPGFVIDVATGALFDIVPNPLEVTLEPLGR